MFPLFYKTTLHGFTDKTDKFVEKQPPPKKKRTKSPAKTSIRKASPNSGVPIPRNVSMANTHKPIRKNPIPAKLAGQIYLDPTYDPAFKALFGDENALKDFLDGVLDLEGDDRIKTLRFRFDEPLAFHVPQEKKVILDIFATTGSGRFLNIEMQRWEKDFFIDRAVLYKAFLVIKGRKEMEMSKEFKSLSKEQQAYRRYQLPETISIWICNFDLPRASGEYIDEWTLHSTAALRNGKSEPLSEKNRYIFLSIPNFTKSADEVKGSTEAWLYLLKHAMDGGELPNFGREFVDEALGRIRVENANDELLTAQVKDMKRDEEYETWLAGAKIKAEEQGLAQGLAQGLEKGREEGRMNATREMARGLRDDNVPLDIISKRSGLTIEEILAL